MARLNYRPFKITLQPAYRRGQPGAVLTIPEAGKESLASEIYHAIRSWRRFPVAFGDAGGPDAESVFVLLDRIETPFALLDPKYTTIARAAPCKPKALPKVLRELYAKLVRLGHAEKEQNNEGDPFLP